MVLAPNARVEYLATTEKLGNVKKDAFTLTEKFTEKARGRFKQNSLSLLRQLWYTNFLFHGK